jgi:hypothetical protein
LVNEGLKTPLVSTGDCKRVQGYSDATLTNRGDVCINDSDAPASADPSLGIYSCGIRRDGVVVVRMSDGTEFVSGQVLLFDVLHPERLVRSDLGRYRGVAAAGVVPLEYQGAPDVGLVLSGGLP